MKRTAEHLREIHSSDELAARLRLWRNLLEKLGGGKPGSESKSRP